MTNAITSSNFDPQAFKNYGASIACRLTPIGYTWRTLGSSAALGVLHKAHAVVQRQVFTKDVQVERLPDYDFDRRVPISVGSTCWATATFENLKDTRLDETWASARSATPTNRVLSRCVENRVGDRLSACVTGLDRFIESCVDRRATAVGHRS
jgi:hypothetical protein